MKTKTTPLLLLYATLLFTPVLAAWPTPTGWTSMLDAFTYCNTVTNNLCGLMIFLTFYLPILVSMIFVDFKRGFVAANWIGFLIAVVMQIIGIIGSNITLVFGVLAGLSLILLFIE